MIRNKKYYNVIIKIYNFMKKLLEIKGKLIIKIE